MVKRAQDTGGKTAGATARPRINCTEHNAFDPVTNLPGAMRNRSELDSRRRKAAP
jgi:hypothetical protein